MKDYQQQAALGRVPSSENVNEVVSKQCCHCNAVKPISDFYTVKHRDSVTGRCKTCISDYRKSKRVFKRPILPNGLKKCSRCKQIKNKLTDFCAGKTRVSRCKKCMREVGRAYAKANRAKRNEYVRNKYKRDPNFKLAILIRNRFYSAVRGKVKTSSVLNLLDCSIDELREHLESMFEPGMTWDNYSYNGWHIDHIVPLSAFADPNDPKAWAKSNLRPMWAMDNFKKSGKIIDAQTTCMVGDTSNG